MPNEVSLVAAYIVGIIILVIIGCILSGTKNVVLRLFYNAIIGGMAIAVINLAGNLIHFHIALNPFTALMAGILGIPGVVLLAVFQYLLNI